MHQNNNLVLSPQMATARYRFYEIAVREGLWSSSAALRRYLDWLFTDVDLRGKRVLDVGAGSGLLSCYAALQGASEVVCLEPEAAGATEGMRARFERLMTEVGLHNVVLRPLTFQEFDSAPGTFDVLLLHNSVNHLDERACIDLLRDDGAAETYSRLLGKLATLGSSRAEVVISDCSPSNLFAVLEIRHPISTSIEWHKHQKPEVWRDILQSWGFSHPRIGWSSYNRLGAIGWMLLSNRLGAFFLTGHFRLHMKKTTS